ncbi:hypothetical protein GF378_01800 [Candidatus Pacearchaeota archaeon]|nr:hypothetical protein [Candidatus Pacearchaeota archaeon]
MANKNRIFKKRDKRAALTTQQIVILTILILSFIAVITLYARANLGGITEEQICHNSVVLRGKSVVLGETVPLDCKTQHICFSATKECNVKSMPNPSEVITIESKDLKKATNELNEEIAGLMADCWWMYGEGKIDYLGAKVRSKTYCSNCYVVAFDKSLYEGNGAAFEPQGYFMESVLYDYLVENNLPGSENSYLGYLMGRNIPPRKASFKGEMKFNDFSFDKSYYITMAITTKNYPWIKAGITAITGAAVIVAVAATGGTAAIALAGVTLVSSAGIAANIPGGQPKPFMGITITGESENKYLLPTLIEVGSLEYNNLSCADVVTLS